MGKRIYISLFMCLFCSIVTQAQTIIATNGLTQTIINSASFRDMFLLTGNQTLITTLTVNKDLTIKGDGTPAIVIKQTGTGRRFTGSTARMTINFESVVIIGYNIDYTNGKITFDVEKETINSNIHIYQCG